VQGKKDPVARKEGMPSKKAGREREETETRGACLHSLTEEKETTLKRQQLSNNSQDLSPKLITRPG